MHARDKYYASLLQAKSAAAAPCGESEIATIRVANGLDVSAAARIKAGFKRLIAAGRSEAVVDLSRVERLDSAGLGSFVCALRAMQRIGACVVLVAGGGGRIAKMLELTGLRRTFSVHTSLGAALASFSSAAA